VHEILHTLPDDATLDETGHGGSHAQAIRRALDELDIAALQREAYQSWTPDVMAEVQQQLGTLEDSVGADMKAVESEVNLLLDRMKDTPNAEDGFMVPKGADAEAVKGMIASRLDELGLSDTLQPFDEDGFFVGVRPITEEAAAPAQPAATAVATEEPPLAPERAAPPRRKPDQGVAGGLRLLDADQEVSFGNKRAASMNMTLAQHVGNVAFEGDTPTPQAMSGRTTADMGERLDRKNAALERLKAETQKAKRRAGHRIATLSDTFAAMKVMEDEYPTLSDRVAEAMKLNGYTYTDQYGELQQVVFPHAQRAMVESRARAQKQNDGKVEEAIRAFGTTEDPLDAMFVLPDGTMIKIPGERGDYGHQSHAEIGRLYPSLSPHQAVSQFRADAGALQWSLFGKAGQRVLAITGESPLSPAQQRLILSEGRYADDVVSTIDGQSRFFDPATQRADFGRFIRDKGDTHAEADRARESGPRLGSPERSNEVGRPGGVEESGSTFARAQREEPADSVQAGPRAVSSDANLGRPAGRSQQRVSGYVPGTNVRRNNDGEVASRTRPPTGFKAANQFWSPSQGKVIKAASKAEKSLFGRLEAAMHVADTALSSHGKVVEWRSEENWDGSPLSFNYADQGKTRSFHPDVLVAYQDGHQEIIEVKRTDAPQEEDTFFRSLAQRAIGPGQSPYRLARQGQDGGHDRQPRPCQRGRVPDRLPHHRLGRHPVHG
jgi:hypothetical protein